MNKTVKAKANVNIALIKYWGKRDEELILPMNSSLSLTLDGLYTETMLTFHSDLERDFFYLNDVLQSELETLKVSRMIDLFRNQAGIPDRAMVKSWNHVPTGAGLASSASGYAALAAACNLATGLNLDLKTLSRLARRGSGSACRSIFGGFVLWEKGTNDADSYAYQIDEANWDLAMIIAIVNPKHKAISSRVGMRHTILTSPFYPAWVDSADSDLQEMLEAVKKKDLDLVGRIAERNAMRMHATMFAANPPLIYWQPETLLIMEQVKKLREQGLSCYYTIDAGPNVKILCKQSESQHIIKELSQIMSSEALILTKPGMGVEVSYVC